MHPILIPDIWVKFSSFFHSEFWRDLSSAYIAMPHTVMWIALVGQIRFNAMLRLTQIEMILYREHRPIIIQNLIK